MDRNSEEYKRKEEDFILVIQNPRSSWFSAHLFRLLFKADPNNFKKLQQVYPIEADIVHRYRTENGYFEKLLDSEKNEKENY